MSSTDASARAFTYPWHQMMAAADKLLTQIDNPLHVAIVQNYRRHYLLENAGRWEEVLVPGEMVVPEMRYEISVGKMDQAIYGLDGVRAMYSSFHWKSFPEDEVLAVNDWGIATECMLNQHVSAEQLKRMGHDEDYDPEKRYIRRHRLCMFWHYTDKGLLIGEHSYSQRWSVEVKEQAPDYVEPTDEELAEILNPIIDGQEAEWRASLLV